uniref:Uncharacterized protein n=1 Tax=Sphaerodactylus townsendi TaxID=933632 RepID=A0ACB8FAH1_9SAUR
MAPVLMDHPPGLPPWMSEGSEDLGEVQEKDFPSPQGRTGQQTEEADRDAKQLTGRSSDLGQRLLQLQRLPSSRRGLESRPNHASTWPNNMSEAQALSKRQAQPLNPN